MTEKQEAALRQAREWIGESPERRTLSAGKMVALLTEALSEQQSGIKQVIELYDSPEQPAQQQEPVATVTSESGNPDVSMSWWHEPALPVGTKLYTSPQPSKPWVGLTDEDAQEVIEKSMHAITGGSNTFRISANTVWTAIVHSVEAKLKEKNNG